MLSLEQLRGIVARVSYRDGWSFRVEDSPEGPLVRVVAGVDDAANLGERTDLGVDCWPSPNDRQHPAAFLRWLGWRLQRVECHESREFLRFDGVQVDNPHR